MTKKKNTRTRAKRGSKANHYFTKDHEDAIVKYAMTRDNVIRTDLYVKWIQPAFDEMVDKIIYTYKFTNIPNIDCLKDECKVWLTTILDKYDPSKGSKAFSYFSVITKHWFIHKVKKHSTKVKREVSYENLIRETQHDDLFTVENNYLNIRDQKEYWTCLRQEIDRWQESNLFLKENEQKVIKAVKILLDNVDQIEIFNKKAVYLYLREITGLKTKQIVNCLNKMRERYRFFNSKYHRGEYEIIIKSKEN